MPGAHKIGGAVSGPRMIPKETAPETLNLTNLLFLMKLHRGAIRYPISCGGDGGQKLVVK